MMGPDTRQGYWRNAPCSVGQRAIASENIPQAKSNQAEIGQAENSGQDETPQIKFHGVDGDLRSGINQSVPALYTRNSQA